MSSPPYSTPASGEPSYQHSDIPCGQAIDCFGSDEMDGISRDFPAATSRKKKLVIGSLLVFVFFSATITTAIIASTRLSHESNRSKTGEEPVDSITAASSASLVSSSHTATTTLASTSASASASSSKKKDKGYEKGNSIVSDVGPEERVFLHISDTHADPYYDHEHYLEPGKKISRDPRLYSKNYPAKKCGPHSESIESIVNNWNITSNPGKTCPCGHFGANPPFSVIASLAGGIADHNPEFVIWGGDFVSHYEPGTNTDDDCRTAKNAAMASVSILNVRFGSLNNTQKPIKHLWVFGNNDVVPKNEPLDQDWLEEFGQHLVAEEWLTPEEYETTWIRGGFYRRNLGKGLCVINLNSNSWTIHQINDEHHREQIKWLKEVAFVRGEGADDCNEFIINAHIPLGWLRTGRGHHYWSNLETAVAHEYCGEYRAVIDIHHKYIIAELYGHINKADVRLMGKGSGGDNDDKDESTDGEKDPVSISTQGDPLGDLDENIGEDAKIVAFTVAGISRRANNDPQFQRIILEPQDMLKKHGMKDIEVYSMKGDACFENAFTFAYSFRDLFQPDFDDGINVESVLAFVENDELQRERIEEHLALSSMPYTKHDLKDPDFIDAVRSDKTGCELLVSP